jgi:hypothetical protein
MDYGTRKLKQSNSQTITKREKKTVEETKTSVLAVPSMARKPWGLPWQ